MNTTFYSICHGYRSWMISLIVVATQGLFIETGSKFHANDRTFSILLVEWTDFC